MSWGGIISSALLAGGAGAAQSGYDDIVEKQKNDAVLKRDQILAQLARGTHEANKKFDIQAEIESAPALGEARGKAAKAAFFSGEKDVYDAKQDKDFTLTEGSKRFDKQGNEIASVEKTYAPEKEGEADLRKAQAARLNAEVRALDEGRKDKKQQKDLPHIVNATLDDGSKVVMDRSGAKLSIIDGEEVWKLNGKVLPKGLASVYPDLDKMLDSGSQMLAGPERDKPAPGAPKNATSGKIKGLDTTPSEVPKTGASSAAPKGVIPPGAQPIGKSPDGRTIYKTPDGKKWAI